MARAIRALAAVFLALFMVVGLSSCSDSNKLDGRIVKYEAIASLDEQGSATIDLTIDVDFGKTASHGIFLTFPLRAKDKDPNRWRELPTRLNSVTSPTGANTIHSRETKNGVVIWRVGSESETFTGLHTYKVQYRVKNLVLAKSGPNGEDMLDWNAIGPAWQVTIDNISITVKAPAAGLKTACFSGHDLDRECQAPQSGSSMTWTFDHLDKEEGLEVVSSFPAGTFDSQVTYSKRIALDTLFPLTPVTGGAAGVLALLGAALVGFKLRRAGRDEAYLNLTPGLAPLSGDGKVTTAKGHEVAVQFSPPKNARPGEIGTLTDNTANNSDIVATLIDLAVRGHLTIKNQQSGQVYTRTPERVPASEAESLRGYENRLLTELFKGQDVVRSSEFKDGARSGMMPAVRNSLYEQVTKNLGWFKKRPDEVRNNWIAVGIGVLILAAVLSFTAGLFGYGLLGLALLVPGVLAIVAAFRAPVRTAEGSAMLAQAKGFELYLSTAEADQIKFEEGQDIFSKYLPYAMVFGVADRWTKLFQDLEAQGKYNSDLAWYSGVGYGHGLSSGFSSSVMNLTSDMNSAISASTPSASGGSSGGGFSGGGGIGGGGGGVW